MYRRGYSPRILPGASPPGAAHAAGRIPGAIGGFGVLAKLKILRRPAAAGDTRKPAPRQIIISGRRVSRV